jgi:hypothetical protein
MVDNGARRVRIMQSMSIYTLCCAKISGNGSIRNGGARKDAVWWMLDYSNIPAREAKSAGRASVRDDEAILDCGVEPFPPLTPFAPAAPLPLDPVVPPACPEWSAPVWKPAHADGWADADVAEWEKCAPGPPLPR